MKAWTVVAIAHDGELVCFDCCSDTERRVWQNQERVDDISVVFASDELEEGEVCGRCLEPLID